MPELPEVETIRRSLLPVLVNRTISDVTFGTFPGVIGNLSPDEFRAVVLGRQIVDVNRRGKYLLVDLDDGSGLVIHLRMTGNLTVADPEADPVRFQHLAFMLDNQSSLRFSDQRKFGRVEYRPASVLNSLERKLGPEPLGARFTTAYLADRLRNRVAPIKALILDQRILAGVGNIYVDEALFRSRLHPLTPGGELTTRQVSNLVRSIKSVLRSAIANRGTTFSSYRDGYGDEGANQYRLRVYGRGRHGEPCLRCGRALVTLTAGGRTSHVCLRCQPLRMRDHGDAESGQERNRGPVKRGVGSCRQDS